MALTESRLLHEDDWHSQGDCASKGWHAAHLCTTYTLKYLCAAPKLPATLVMQSRRMPSLTYCDDAMQHSKQVF